MNSHSKKVISISILTTVPLVVIVSKAFIITRRGLSIPEIQFQTIFWMARIILAPAVVIYLVRFWTDINRVYLLVLRLTTGFAAYLSLHWSLSFIFCKFFLHGFDPRNWNLFSIIKNESSLLNFFSYIISIFIFYLWIYVERFGKAAGHASLLEKELADSQLELLKQTEDLKLRPAKEALDKLTIKTGSKVTVVSIQRIAYLQADGPYVKIIADEKIHLLNTPLYEMEMMLPKSFLRIHRSRIVNVEFIKQVESLQNGDYILELRDGTEIRASRTYRERLRAALGQL